MNTHEMSMDTLIKTCHRLNNAYRQLQSRNTSTKAPDTYPLTSPSLLLSNPIQSEEKSIARTYSIRTRTCGSDPPLPILTHRIWVLDRVLNSAAQQCKSSKFTKPNSRSAPTTTITTTINRVVRVSHNDGNTAMDLWRVLRSLNPRPYDIILL